MLLVILATLFVWCFIGFLNTLWGLKGKRSSELFFSDVDIFCGIALGPITFFFILNEKIKMSPTSIRDKLYNMVNKHTEE